MWGRIIAVSEVSLRPSSEASSEYEPDLARARAGDDDAFDDDDLASDGPEYEVTARGGPDGNRDGDQ